MLTLQLSWNDTDQCAPVTVRSENRDKFFETKENCHNPRKFQDRDMLTGASGSSAQMTAVGVEAAGRTLVLAERTGT